MMLAWRLYADDNGSRLAYNANQTSYDEWYDKAFPVNELTDEKSMMLGLLGKYTANSSIYHCPADNALAANGLQKVRSISMNAYMGGQNNGQFYPAIQASAFPKFTKLEQFRYPCDTFVFLDENPDTINDGVYWTADPLDTAIQFTDYPASYHNKCCGLSFADGHSEIHKWLDSSTLIVNSPASGSNDVQWLCSKTSQR